LEGGLVFEDAIEVLEKDRIRNVNALNFIRDNRINSTEIVGDSVLIRGFSDRPWVYISSTSQEELKELTSKLTNEDKCFAVIEDWMTPLLYTKEEELRWKLTSVKLYYPDTTALPSLDFEENVKIELLHINDAQFMYDHYDYKEYASVPYIRSRIEKGVGLGLFKDKKLVGWIMTHDDGAMGFLHVLNEYRSRGYAMALSVSLIKMLRAMGEVPFVHIEPHNHQSMNLAIKAGFEKDRLINWFEMK
jgi:8-oxo-dGTP diphosphatase